MSLADAPLRSLLLRVLFAVNVLPLSAGLSACGNDVSSDCLAAIDCAAFIDDNFGSDTKSEAESLFLDPSCWENSQAAEACSLACFQFREDSQALIDQSTVEDTGICHNP